VKERKEPSGVFYYWKGERPRHPNAPQLDGTGESLVRVQYRPPPYTSGFGWRSHQRTWASWTETTIEDARS